MKEVLQGGAVDLDGRILIGDHILSVNDQSLVGLNHQQVKYVRIFITVRVGGHIAVGNHSRSKSSVRMIKIL